MKIKKIAKQSIIAAIYVCLSYVTFPLSFTMFQIRLSEAMCILPFFGKEYIVGITIGCALTNFLLYGNFFDVIFGTIATLIGAFGTYYFRKKVNLALFFPVCSNTVIIPLVFKYAYGMEMALPYLFIQMIISEFIAVFILGRILLLFLHKIRIQ